MKTLMNYMKKTGEGVLDLLYPHTCPFCGKVSKEAVCSTCVAKVVYIREPRCKKCGKPIRKETMEYCLDCAHTYHYYDRGYALWLHREPVSTSIYQFKYHNRRIYGRFYAEELAKVYGNTLQRWNIQTIIPIPLSKKRRRQRGFNQAEVVANHLGKLLNIPVDSRHLARVRDTSPQKKLDPAKRRENIKKAFVWRGNSQIKGPVLLVDDIYTTGNTIDSAARVLKRAGAGKVYFLTISIGQGY